MGPVHRPRSPVSRRRDVPLPSLGGHRRLRGAAHPRRPGPARRGGRFRRQRAGAARDGVAAARTPSPGPGRRRPHAGTPPAARTRQVRRGGRPDVLHAGGARTGHAGQRRPAPCPALRRPSRRRQESMGSLAGSVLDLGCGIGGDLVARGRAGCRGVGVDLDPLTAAVARANLGAFGLEDSASVRTGDATVQDPAGHAAVFADPGRRGARGRIFNPEAYDPRSHRARSRRGRPGGLREGGPGHPARRGPARRGGRVDLRRRRGQGGGALAGRPLRRTARHDAAARDPAPRGPETATTGGRPELGPPPSSGWRRYLYEPDGAVVRAHLVAEVAARSTAPWPIRASRMSPLTHRWPHPSRGLRDPRGAAVLGETAAGRAEATRRGTLTIKKRGFAADIERLRRELRPSGPRSAFSF